MDQEDWTNTTHDWAALVDEQHLSAVRAGVSHLDPGGLPQLICEVLAYADDEAVALTRLGLCLVELSEDGSVSVADDGRGTDTRVDEHGWPIRKGEQGDEASGRIPIASYVDLARASGVGGIEVGAQREHERGDTEPQVRDVERERKAHRPRELMIGSRSTLQSLSHRFRLGTLPRAGHPDKQYPISNGQETTMSFQAYLDAAEENTGRTPQEIVDLAHVQGFGADTRSGVILEWPKSEFDLGRGHGMALFHVIKNGPETSDRHVGSTGTHRDESAVLRLDGVAARSQGT